MNRREFLKLAGLTAGAALLRPLNPDGGIQGKEPTTLHDSNKPDTVDTIQEKNEKVEAMGYIFPDGGIVGVSDLGVNASGNQEVAMLRETTNDKGEHIGILSLYEEHGKRTDMWSFSSEYGSIQAVGCVTTEGAQQTDRVVNVVVNVPESDGSGKYNISVFRYRYNPLQKSMQFLHQMVLGTVGGTDEAWRVSSYGKQIMIVATSNSTDFTSPYPENANRRTAETPEGKNAVFYVLEPSDNTNSESSLHIKDLQVLGGRKIGANYGDDFGDAGQFIPGGGYVLGQKVDSAVDTRTDYLPEFESGKTPAGVFGRYTLQSDGKLTGVGYATFPISRSTQSIAAGFELVGRKGFVLFKPPGDVPFSVVGKVVDSTCDGKDPGSDVYMVGTGDTSEIFYQTDIQHPVMTQLPNVSCLPGHTRPWISGDGTFISVGQGVSSDEIPIVDAHIGVGGKDDIYIASQYGDTYTLAAGGSGSEEIKGQIVMNGRTVTWGETTSTDWDGGVSDTPHGFLVFSKYVHSSAGVRHIYLPSVKR